MFGEVKVNELFLVFIAGLFIIMLLFGIAMLCVILFDGHEIGLRMVNIFAGMFSGVLGLGTGYLLGIARKEHE